MQDRVRFYLKQMAALKDFENLGLFPQKSFDTIVYDFLFHSMKFVGFVPTAQGASVNIGDGRFTRLGKIYYNNKAGGEVINLTAHLPAVTQRWIAIVVAGAEQNVEPEQRTFVTNVQTGALQYDTKDTVIRRWAVIDAVSGVVGPEPARPVISPVTGTLVVAWVLCDPNGIVRVERALENLAPNLEDVDETVDELVAWRDLIAALLDTIRSDIAGLAARMKLLAKQEFVNLIAADMARVKERLQLPMAYTAYQSDSFLSYQWSDATHVDFLARVEEGVRYSDGSILDTQLGLLDNFDPLVKVQDFFVLPDYAEAYRFGQVAFDEIQAIASYPYLTLDYVQKSRSRWRWRFGSPFMLCTNWLNGPEYIAHAGVFDPVSSTFKFYTGEQWFIMDTAAYLRGDYQNVRAQAMWIDYFEETYIEQVVTQQQASGSVMGNTFLNSQDGWLTSIWIPFESKGSTGDVWCLICETFENGEPDVGKVIARSTVTVGNIKTYNPIAEYTKFNFTPTFLRAGRRFAFVLVTAGNHRVYLARGNKYNQGSMFYITDGRWAAADPGRDISFMAFFARFTSPRVEVNMLPLTLENGIAAIDVLAQAIVPPQCQIRHLVNVPAVGWTDLGDMVLTASETGLDHPLAALPALLPYKIVLIGTTESMPGFGVGVNSRIRTRRPRSDKRHISEPVTCPSSNKVTAKIRLENWFSDRHSFAIRLLTGAGYTTVRIPDTDVREVAPDDPRALLVTAVWNLGTPVTSFRVRMEGTTNNIHVLDHVAQRVTIEESV
jgi:hypothetical protein